MDSSVPFKLLTAGYPVLVAVQETSVGRLCEQHLQRAGFPVRLCSDGPSAAATAEAYPPRLSVMDEDMYWAEGAPLLLRLHADPAFATLPVVILLNRSNDDPVWVRHDAYRYHCFLTKPFTPAELVSFCKRILHGVAVGELPPLPQTTLTSHPTEAYWQAWRKQLPPFALFNAARGRDRATVSRLIRQGADVRARDRQGWTALHEACFGGSLAVVRLLLGYGAEVNAATQEGATPLFYAADGAHVAVVRLLLFAGADANARTEIGDTPLLRVLKYGNSGKAEYQKRREETVDLLLKSGADPNAQNAEGETPLLRAKRRGQASIAQMLVRAGAKT